jgi:hypothetical protein
VYGYLVPGMLALLIGLATIGISFSLQAGFADRRATDRAVRLALAAVSLATRQPREFRGNGREGISYP